MVGSSEAGQTILHIQFLSWSTLSWDLHKPVFWYISSSQWSIRPPCIIRKSVPCFKSAQHLHTMARPWNGIEWKGNDEWRHLKWHRDISKLAPFSIGRGTSTSTSTSIRIGTSIYHRSNHGPKYESRGKRIPGWLAGWSLEIFVGTGEFLLYSVLLPLPISYGLWPPLSRCISINSGYMPSTPSTHLLIHSSKKEGWGWILPASWDWTVHVCTTLPAFFLIGVYSGVHAGYWSFTGLLCRSHDSIRFVICEK